MRKGRGKRKMGGEGGKGWMRVCKRTGKGRGKWVWKGRTEKGRKRWGREKEGIRVGAQNYK